MCLLCSFFLCKQKTAYEMRISDWSSDVCSSDLFAGTRPRLNFLLDGRALTFNESIYIDGGIWDLQQIEVYRGPQSTLQGRNAIGGVVAIKTADPSFDRSEERRVGKECGSTVRTRGGS